MDIIRKAREAKDLTQRELAFLIGVDNSTVGKWESGRRTPRLEHLLKLIKILDLDESTIIQAYGGGK